MSPRKKSKKIEVERAEEAEDRESLAEEDSEGTLSPSPELEEALREAAAAVDEAETRQEAERARRLSARGG